MTCNHIQRRSYHHAERAFISCGRAKIAELATGKRGPNEPRRSLASSAHSERRTTMVVCIDRSKSPRGPRRSQGGPTQSLTTRTRWRQSHKFPALPLHRAVQADLGPLPFPPPTKPGPSSPHLQANLSQFFPSLTRPALLFLTQQNRRTASRYFLSRPTHSTCACDRIPKRKHQILACGERRAPEHRSSLASPPFVTDRSNMVPHIRFLHSSISAHFGPQG